jgi:transposase
MKAVPGRKTDVKDAEWLADLLHLIWHGLLKARFIPLAPVRELRELTRYRQALLHERHERTQQLNRLHNHLESANLT